MDSILVFVLFFALVIAVIAVSAYLDRRRTEALGKVASSLGLDFYPTGESAMFSGISNFRLGSHGHSRRIKNLMQGTIQEHGLSIPLAIFDYQYTTGHGKHRRTHRQTILLLFGNQLKLPDFFLRPEGLFDKIGGMFGFQDIDLPDHPKFSRQYLLKGSNPSAISELFTDDLVAFYEGRQAFTEACYGRVIFYQPGMFLSPDRISSLVAEGISLFECLTCRF